MSLDNLPVEWIVSNVGKVLNNTNNLRKPVSSKEREKIKGDYPYYGATGKIDGLNSYTHDGEYILMGEDGANLLSRVKDQAFVVKGKFWVNNHAHSLQASCGMPSNFFSYYLNQVDLQPFITGSAQPKLTRQNLDSIPMLVVPLAEQQEIVRQLDIMLAQVEKIKARLDAIPAILKKFRQSVLADAVSGRLTEDTNFSKWIKSTIGTEFKCIDGDRGKNYPKKEDYQTEGYCLFLSTKNVRKFGFLFDEKVFISEQKHQQLRNGTLQRDDLIITTRGTLGHIASYDTNVPFDVVRINSGMLILRKIKQNLLNEFMMLLLASPKFQRIIEEQRTGSAQPQLPAKILKEFEIELPSLDEQKIIVKKVESYFKLIEKIEDTVQSAQKRVNLLTQSILAKAFSGELTAEWREQHQDLITGINSAESLLAKIQAEREASKPVKKTRAKKEA